MGQSDASTSTVKEEETDGKSTLKWLQRQKKRAKENALKMAKEQEEAEALSLKQLRDSSKAYSEKDLKGIKVAHDLEDLEMEEGEERILTLKDGGVLDDDEDELEEASLKQRESDAKNEERRRGAKDYTGLDDDEFDETAPAAPGKRRGILSKYDGDLDREGFLQREDGRAGFVLGSASSSIKRPAIAATFREQDSNRMLLDLSYTKNQETSDYLQEGDVGFKKPKGKKKKKASSKIKLELDDAEPAVKEEDEEMAELVPTLTRKERNATAGNAQTENFVDDDELAAALARSRRQKAKKNFIKMTPEEIAKNLAAQKKAAEQAAAATNGSRVEAENGMMTFDTTSEFVRTIGLREREEEEERQRRAAMPRQRSHGIPEAEAEEAAAKAEQEEPEAGPSSRVQLAATVQDEGEDAEMGEIEEEIRRQTANGMASVPPVDPLVEPTGNEPLVSGGMASTLALLRSTGALETVSKEKKDLEAEQRKYDRWLAERRAEERLREAERAASKAQGSAKDQATREYENRQRELDEARRAQEKFKDYKPDVELKYFDQHGREMQVKEAWKHLSHRFHGRMPGHKAQEKMMKKIELEKQSERMAAGDTPNGMAHAFAERVERMGQAHMVLSVGNQGNAPQDIALLGPNSINTQPQQTKTNGKAKGKAKAKHASSPMPPVLGADSPLRTGSSTPAPPTPAEPEKGPAPPPPKKMKAAFAPIRSQQASSKPPSSAATPGSSSGFRLELPSSTAALKRKTPADEETNGTGDAASKRR